MGFMVFYIRNQSRNNDDGKNNIYYALKHAYRHRFRAWNLYILNRIKVI